MNNLGRITKRSGTEFFCSSENKLQFSLEDFWSWTYSDLLNNVTRGCLAEFIVARALNAIDEIRNPWAAYDLNMPTDSGKTITVEVKSAAYLQSWEQDKPSKIQFDIRKTKTLDEEKSKYVGDPTRHADVYVFALLKEQEDKTRANPLDVDGWDFYVVPTFRLNARTRSQESVTLNSLQHEEDIKTLPVTFSDLPLAVISAAALHPK